MQVIGVLDLHDGRAVHARGGRREAYAPVGAAAGSAFAAGDALALARTYVGRAGVTDLYAADLDAISGGSWQAALVGALTALGAPLWLDAGISSPATARRALHLGAAHVVVGLESLRSYDALDEICAVVGGDRIAFSLDLRGGRPVALRGGSGGRPGGASEAAARAARAGAAAVIVLDLDRVGTGTGPDLRLIARVREAAPGVRLLAGGGVRGYHDLARLADAGCDGALVATALLDGRLDAAGVASAECLAGRSRGGREI
jgi:phosphoribosylformimino-5-aminoimidazole carboxamide ribotide isomerase